MFAKLVPVGFLPLILRSLVLYTPVHRPFNEKKKSNLNRLCATVILHLFSLILALQKLCISYYLTSNVRIVQV